MAAAPYHVRGLKNTWVVDTHVNNILGRGAFGIVYGGNGFAAKRIDDQAVHGKILNQVTPLLTLQHDNLVKLYDVASEGHCSWIFMERCSNGDLQTYLKTYRLSLDQKVDLMIQAMCGVEYLHSYNIIHRDISPSNILVANGTAKLGDFDLCRFLDPNGQSSGMSSHVGAIAFRAPEFFLRGPDGNIHYHRNVDVFASALTFLGMLQYEGTRRWMLPHAETLVNDGTFVLSIGQVLAQRFLDAVVQSTTVKERSTWDYLLALFVGVVAGIATGGVAYLATGTAYTAIAAGGALGLTAGGTTLYFLDGIEYTQYNNDPFSAVDNENTEQAKAKRAALRQLIQRMTCFRPENRPVPSQVIQDLRTLRKY